MMQAIIQTTKAVIMAVKEAENSSNAARSVQLIPITDSPALKQPTFICKTVKKYQELQSFELQVKNISITNSYNIQDNKKGSNHTQLAWWRRTQIYANIKR